MKKLSVLLYAVNGAGVGHLARLLAIARWMRRYCALLDARAEITFLTSSEASALCFRDDFASFKLPSKTVVRDAGMSKPSYLRVAKQWVYSSIAALHPELLVVDSFPNGSFNELLPVLDTVPQKCFVYRAAKSEFAQRASFQALLPLYDRILVPHEPGEVSATVPASVKDRVVHTGAILGREREELVPRAEARARVGVPGADDLCVYVTAGGGGDPLAERALDAILAAARGRPGTHVVVGAGPLYRGVERHGPGVTWLSRGDAPELMNAFDAAISAGGYNAFHELLHHGVPTAFFAQAKVADSQRTRVERAVAAGAALDLGARPATDVVAAALDRLADPALRAKMSAAARALVPENHARDAALEALSLVLDRRDLEEARAVAGAGLLASVRDTGASFDIAAEVAGTLARGRRSSDRARERRTIERFLRAASDDLDGARAPLVAALEKRYPKNDDAEDLARGTALVLERAAAAGLQRDEALPVLVRGLARRMKSASGRPGDVAKAVAVLLDLAKDHGLDAARALVDALPPDEGEVTPLQLELALRGASGAARGEGGLAAVRRAALAAIEEDPGAGSLVVLERAARAPLSKELP